VCLCTGQQTCSILGTAKRVGVRNDLGYNPYRSFWVRRLGQSRRAVGALSGGSSIAAGEWLGGGSRAGGAGGESGELRRAEDAHA